MRPINISRLFKEHGICMGDFVCWPAFETCIVDLTTIT